MTDEVSMLLVIILAIGGVMMMTTLLVCYACIFRDLCCRQGERGKRRRTGMQSPHCDVDDVNRHRLDAIPMNDITQGESMPTESEKV